MSLAVRDRLTGLKLPGSFRNIASRMLARDYWRTSSLLAATIGLLILGSWRAGGPMKLIWRRKRQTEASEPSLITKHTYFHEFMAASGHVYPSIRVFYHAHKQAAKLPSDLPLLVFMHGLGGNATQFAPLLTSLVNVGACLAIDLPGSGKSDFRPSDPAAYTTAAFAELLCAAIEKYRDAANDQQVVLIGHSMGCSIAALLASSTSPLKARLQADYIIGMVAISPRSRPFTESQARTVERLKWMPTLLFDVIRAIDRRGGLQSASITRLVGEGADTETRKLQQTFNVQSKSAVFLRTVMGMLPSATDPSIAMPGKEIWSGIKVPLFLIGGEADTVTAPKEVEQIATWLTKPSGSLEALPTKSMAATEAEQRSREIQQDGVSASNVSDEQAKAEHTTETIPTTAGDVQIAQYQLSSDTSEPRHDSLASTTGEENNPLDEQKDTKHSFALKTTILPAPAAHGLLYSTATVRILAGLVETFLAQHIDEHLSPGWQLQHMTTSGKWEVKNLAKWQKIAQCSEPIAGVFRAMKTMREIDDVHNPREFVKQFSYTAIPDGVAMVVDISHESPVYNPSGLKAGGVEYHKIPTVSKTPPTVNEVRSFVDLIDRLRQSPTLQSDGERRPTIGVHCHYGFNRTGFFVVCYLIERLGYEVQDAIQEFAVKRPPGIKHEHFVNKLYVRYGAKIQRRGTIVE